VAGGADRAIFVERKDAEQTSGWERWPGNAMALFGSTNKSVWTRVGKVEMEEFSQIQSIAWLAPGAKWSRQFSAELMVKNLL
jgi:hypothetical protein